MTNTNLVVQVKQIIDNVSSSFEELAKTHGIVDYKKEASFAMQLMKPDRNGKNFLRDTALKDPESLQYAVLNVASIGLSLNPALKHAYLVPRMGKVILDISYMGMCHLATESGAIAWIQSRLVYEGESITVEFGKAPKHQTDMFAKKDKIIGCYVVAKTNDGDFLTESMSIEEIFKIRDRSESFKKGYGPWITDTNEMIKKTVVKRSFKMLPKTDKRMLEANHMLNTVNQEGINFEEENKIEICSKEQLEIIRRILPKMPNGGRSEGEFLIHAKKVAKYEIESIEDLNVNDAQILIRQIEKFDIKEINEPELIGAGE
jgi:recombination protein RecT